jgi:hypothetical protein
MFSQVVTLREKPEKNIMQDGRCKQKPGISPDISLVIKRFVAQKTEGLLMQIKIYLTHHPPYRKRDQAGVNKANDQDTQFNPYHKNS